VSSARSVVLIGYRGAGKSTVGALLARRLGFRFIDTDVEVERREGISIAALFESGEEARFRRQERAVVAEIPRDVPCVVATGGGAPLNPASRVALREMGDVFYLAGDLATLARRIAGSDRPSLTGKSAVEEIEAVLLERDPTYRAIADEIVDTSRRTPEEICDVIQQLRRGLPHHHLR
jgi:shikimate dehydrogenase